MKFLTELASKMGFLSYQKMVEYEIKLEIEKLEKHISQLKEENYARKAILRENAKKVLELDSLL